MVGHHDRTDARTATTVRDREGLVQVEVGHVTAEAAGPGQTHQRIHVGPVNVDLPASLMHHLAQARDGVLEDTVGARVGDHDRGDPAGVLGDLRRQVRQVHLAIVGRVDGHDLQPGHRRRGGIGAMRR